MPWQISKHKPMPLPMSGFMNLLHWILRKQNEIFSKVGNFRCPQQSLRFSLSIRSPDCGPFYGSLNISPNGRNAIREHNPPNQDFFYKWTTQGNGLLPIFSLVGGILWLERRLSVFGRVVAGAFQITFRAKMHANDFFYFFKIIFDISTSKRSKTYKAY